MPRVINKKSKNQRNKHFKYNKKLSRNIKRKTNNVKHNKQSKKKKNKKKTKKEKGGREWASWEGSSTMRDPFNFINYNRFYRAPYLSEMLYINPR
mgnify:CR=1 FL=1